MSKKIAFTIPEYMTSLILPKCALVHSPMITTVYLQIALNINHQTNVSPWKKEGCWLYNKTIAERTGYNARFIGAALQTLIDLNLISVSQHNLLTIYRLKNHDIDNHEELMEFNQEIETKLLDGKTKTEVEECISLFRELEAINQLDNVFQFKRVLRKEWFEDLVLLRNWITQSEKIYKGSSLFFINNLALNLFKYTNEDSSEPQGEVPELDYISNKERALLSGTSPSTISRYINAFIKSGCLTIEEYSTNAPQSLILSDNFLANKNLISVVDEEMTNEKKITCPICNKEFDTYKDLGGHVTRTKDAKHEYLKSLKNQKKCKVSELHQLYLDVQDEIESLEDNYVPKKDNYLQVPSACSMPCKKCYKLYRKDEIWLECEQQRKMAFIQEFNIKDDVKEVAKTEEPVKVEVKKVKEIKNDVIVAESDAFDIVKTVKVRKINPDKANGLVNYFYDKIQRKCIGYQREMKLVKRALDDGVTPDGVRMTLDYMADIKKQENLNLFNHCLPESYEYQEFMKQIDTEGTAPYLLKMYYEGSDKPIDYSKFVFEVKKIKNLFDTYSYEQLYGAIQYMVAIKCPTINFIGNKVTEALSKMKQVSANKNNPCLYDRDNLHHIKSDLQSGRKKIKDIDERFREDAIKLAKGIIKEGNIPNAFGGIEWAWYIGLELDNEMYSFAQGNIKCPRLDEIIDNPNTKSETRQKAIKAREVFYAWVNKQISKFEQKEVM